MNFKYISIICLILVICNLNAVSASTNTVSMSDLTTGLGFTIDAEIGLSTTDSYDTGTITVNYNPVIVHAIDVKGSQDSTISAFNIDNINGNVTISAMNLNGATGDFPFAIVTFKAIDTGTSLLDISVDTLQDISYNPVTASINNGSITILAGVSIGDYNTDGSNVNADIRINTTENYGTGVIKVNYNPSIIQAANVLGEDVAAWNADNTHGLVNITTLNPGSNSGDFIFATVVFKPVSNGKSQLDIEVNLLQNISYNDIPAATSSGSITVDMGSSTSSSSSGGGGGGGGGTSGEDFYNILISETEREYVNKGSEVSYSFDSEGNMVRCINFTGVTSSGTIAAKIEILNHTSAIVDQAPTDIVYRNLNIWVGNLGWANSRNIADPTISFKVEKSWINENNIGKPTIRLNRYCDGNWNQLMTTMQGEDARYLYFESQTPGFSPFAITGEKASVSYSSGASEVSGVAGSGVTEEEFEQIPDTTSGQDPVEKQPGFGLFAGVSMLLIAIQILCEKK